MKFFFIWAFVLYTVSAYTQGPDSVKSEAWQKIYRVSATKINDLVSTKLDVSFDFTKSWMYGKAWITLHPHFYPTDSLNLDAKSMTINDVSLVRAGKNIPLKFRYDSLTLFVTLDRTYKAGENYTVYVNYTAKPNEIKRKGSAAISGGKGLYFINPLGKDKKKPTQIWTQGETESNSGWFPTIDKPNQKTTNEISMTVPDKYQTLSNGMLISRRKNTDGTRTDTWKMTLPHAPYLMMMAVGEYSVVKDSYKGKEVSYYVEKEYVPVVRKIFGYTPEMIGYFSKVTGVDYPWPKYAQIVARDYISGAMENTTATLHSSSAQQNARQLVDGNKWEDVISHELFHMWFGDYVTCESWSNITVNESLADFSEILWQEHKHGQDAADELNYNSMENYIHGGNENKELVRFYYNDREDLFDLVSYQKGGRILNMLRNWVGDSALYKSFNLYLRTKKFGSAEAHDLRLAFEEVTGQDLNWFWNQWFYGSGHPKLDITYEYNDGDKTARVFVHQTQTGQIFKLPVAVDVYEGAVKKRYKVWIEHQADTFTFHTVSRPELINVDGDKILLCEKTDHKSIDNYIFQYKKAGLYADRREAIDFAARTQSEDPKALDLLKTAMKDKYYGLRLYTVQKLNITNDSLKMLVRPLLTDLAGNDPKPVVRAGAIEALGRYKDEVFKPLFFKAMNDSSYSVAGSALNALELVDTASALKKARLLAGQDIRGDLADAVTNILFTHAGENDLDSLAVRFEEIPFGNEKFMILQPFANLLKRTKNTARFIKGIDIIIRFRDTIPEQYRPHIYPYLNDMILNSIAVSKQSEGMTEQAEYVKSKLPGRNNEEQKGKNQ